MSHVLIVLLVHVRASLNCCLCTNIRCPDVTAWCVVISLSRWSYSSVGGHIAQSVASVQFPSSVLTALPDLNSVHERRSSFVAVLFLFVGRGLLVEVLIYVHRNRRFIRDRSPGRHLDFHTPPEL